MKKLDNVKEWSIFGSGIITLLAGIVLVFVSVYMPPIGEIHYSVLTALGEFLTFAGSCLGIASYTAIKLRQIKHSDENNNEE